MALQPPLATPEDAATLGKGVISETALLVASIRVREYINGRATAAQLASPSDSLIEIVCSVAARIQSDIGTTRDTAIASESSDGVSVTFGFDAYQAVSDLASAEMRRIDRIFPRLPFTMTFGW